MKVVLRLLDAQDQLVASDVFEAVGKGDGWLWTPGAVIMPVESDGPVTTLSLHLTDVNAEFLLPLTMPVTKGGTAVLFATSTPLIQLGTPPRRRLPPVTVRQPITSVIPPAGWRG